MRLSHSFILLFSAATVLIAVPGCNNPQSQNKTVSNDTTTTTTVNKLNVPDFNADSAYTSVNKQVSFGPRTPGSAAQQECASWMETQLKTVCDTVYTQNVHVTGGDGKSLPCINLIGVIHPKATKRILLLTHWDSRPWADMDTKDKDKPILAADDGGSGVGVLLEVARQIKTHTLAESVGVDILFTDVEDYGRTEWGDDSYCLGTQYWAHHPHVPAYKADFGILLDMVGAHGAQFPLEGESTKYAANVQQNVWQAAGRAGYSSYFPFANAADITDDHVPVNVITNIPTIDIINLSTNAPGSPFAAHWHTHQDNMDIIDKNTLKAVGQTLLQVIYEAGQ
jgi:glutaminyl-peptide cyclotransferase